MEIERNDSIGPNCLKSAQGNRLPNSLQNKLIDTDFDELSTTKKDLSGGNGEMPPLHMGFLLYQPYMVGNSLDESSSGERDTVIPWSGEVMFQSGTCQPPYLVVLGATPVLPM